MLHYLDCMFGIVGLLVNIHHYISNNDRNTQRTDRKHLHFGNLEFHLDLG